MSKLIFGRGGAEKIKVIWVGLLGQPSGLAGGRVGTAGRVGPAGRVVLTVVWDWVNQYWADLTKNALFVEKRSL